MNANTCTLSEITDTSAGGKAYGLARLVGMGLSVPPAFVVRNASSKDFPHDLDRRYQDLGEGLVAVRSSALGEDGDDASFAGQYDTVLNVEGVTELRQAIQRCVASSSNERAKSYQREQAGVDVMNMNVVVQAMVNARAAGVVFTADPVSARRDMLVIDAVAGLGEALVSGEATPDHYGVHSDGSIVRRQLTATEPVLSDQEVALIAEQARAAVAHEGHPLDLEWAIDQDGGLYWLQARPITTLPADLNEFDTTLPRPDDVLTISNVSEMMPGAVCPLTGSFTGWGIDYGLQHMQVAVGARPEIVKEWQITAWAYGHLFLNLTGNVVMSSAVLGSTVEQTAQALCGRIVPELKALSPQPFLQRVSNTASLLRYCLSAPKVVEKFGRELDAFVINNTQDSATMWAQLEENSAFFDHAMAVHIQSSALSGFLCSIVENMVSGQSNNSTSEEQGEAVRLLAGATGVESAVMLEELDSLVDSVSAHPESEGAFQKVDETAALAWLQSSPELSPAFNAFLLKHGHRGYRELCMRDSAWIDDPQPLIQSMQAGVHARRVTGGRKLQHVSEIDWAALSRGLRWILPKAHNAIRRREHTKSQLVDTAHRFKRGYRHLGELLREEGVLPDADLLNFFTVEELPDLVAGCSTVGSRAHCSVARHWRINSNLSFPKFLWESRTPLKSIPCNQQMAYYMGGPPHAVLSRES